MASFSLAQALMDKGPSRPTLYKLIMPVVSNKVQKYLELYVTQTVIPTISLQTAKALGQEYMGITREQPIAVLYQKPLSLTVIGDSDYNAYKELRKWLDKTTFNINQDNSARRSHRLNYYDNYVEDITLIKLEQPNDPEDDEVNEEGYKEALKVKFINSYPVNLGQIELNSEGFNQAVRFNVDFTYESYSLDTREGNIPSIVSSVGNLLA